MSQLHRIDESSSTRHMKEVVDLHELTDKMGTQLMTSDEADAIGVAIASQQAVEAARNALQRAEASHTRLFGSLEPKFMRVNDLLEERGLIDSAEPDAP